MGPRTIVIGTRGSTLALVQTELAAAALRAADPSLRIEVRVIETKGDTNQHPIPLDSIGKGWFTGEIESALTDGSITLAVHSLKDLADDMQEGLRIGAYLPREDARDALVTKGGKPLEALPRGAVVGTDSARRQAQMRAMRPDLEMKSLRGNVPTRLEKLAREGYDAIILAAAGLKRLGLEERVTRYFDEREMTSAPGQGIMAVQMKEGDAALSALLARVNDARAARAAEAERAFSRTAGGGCKSATGAYAWEEGGELRLIGMVEAADGRILRNESRGSLEGGDAQGAALARDLLAARDGAA